MKRKTITLVVYMLVCISLVSVGFAAWVITGGDTETTNGNISATAVTDESVAIDAIGWDTLDDSGKITFGETRGSIVFGQPEEEASSTGWLQYSASTTEVADLNAIYAFTVSSANALNTSVQKLVSANISVSDSNIDALQDDAEDPDDKYYISDATIEYVVATSLDELITKVNNDQFKGFIEDTDNPNTTESNFKEDLEAVSTTECYVAVKVEYNWGNLFDSKNPYEFYNEKTAGEYIRKPNAFVNGTSGDTWKQHATTHLSHLFNTLNNDTQNQTNEFTLNISILGEGE